MSEIRKFQVLGGIRGAFSIARAHHYHAAHNASHTQQHTADVELYIALLPRRRPTRHDTHTNPSTRTTHIQLAYSHTLDPSPTTSLFSMSNFNLGLQATDDDVFSAADAEGIKFHRELLTWEAGDIRSFNAVICTQPSLSDEPNTLVRLALISATPSSLAILANISHSATAMRNVASWEQADPDVVEFARVACKYPAQASALVSRFVVATRTATMHDYQWFLEK
jgi:hypothetical protein